MREWAHFRHRIGISTNEFLESTPDSLRALALSFDELEKQRDQRQAAFMCLMFNLLRPAKVKAKTYNDFMPQKVAAEKPRKTTADLFSAFDNLTKNLK